MIKRVWTLEFRTRKRANGKWSEWSPVLGSYGYMAAYGEYPDHKVLSYPAYEIRAVEYSRVEPSQQPYTRLREAAEEILREYEDYPKRFDEMAHILSDKLEKLKDAL